MHHGSDHMGAPSFAQRRPNASSLPQFELPPPHQQKYSYATQGSQASQALGSLTSVGNLLTPPSTTAGEGNSPSLSGASTMNSSTSVAPSYASNNAYWSPQAHGNYSFQNGHAYQSQHSRAYSPHQNVIRSTHTQAHDSPLSSHYDNNLPSFSNSAAMSAPPTLATMGPPQHHQPSPQPHAGLSSAPSPAHSQDQFRAPSTSQYYSHQQNTPHHFQYSSGPSPTISTPLSAGGLMGARSQMSPASAGPTPLSAPPLQHGYPGRFSSGYHAAHGPVLTNLSNPNGPPMLVGGMPQGLMGFNSGHSASLQHMYSNSPHPSSQPAHNDRPFKCDQCPQSFNRNHDLKRHKRIHLAVKPFPCGHCEKSFSRKDALKVLFAPFLSFY